MGLPSCGFWRGLLIVLCFPGLTFPAVITIVSPALGRPGDVIQLNGSGFDPTPANNIVRFGPNRAPVLTAVPTQLTVRVPNGQPLGPTIISVGGTNGPTFNTVAIAKPASDPPNPGAGCGGCSCRTCCRPPNSSPCSPGGIGHLGPPLGGRSGDVFGERGEFFQDITDLVIAGRPGAAEQVQYALTRVYRAASTRQGPLGPKWDHIYFERLEPQPDGSIIHHDGLGRNDVYLLNNQGQFIPPAEFFTQLTKNGNGTYTLRFRDGLVKQFDTAGKITQITDRNGNSLTFSYNSQNRLQTVTDTLGRSIAYSYNASGQLVTVTDFIGRTVNYGYSTAGDLISVTSPVVTGTPNGNDFPAGKTTLYTYDSSHLLLTVTRPDEAAVAGPPVLTNTYDSSGRIIRQLYGGTNSSGIAAGGFYRYTYTPLNTGSTSDDPNFPVMRTQETDPNRNVTQYDYNRLGYVLVLRQFTRGIRSTDPPVYVTTMAYDADGMLVQKLMPAGNSIQYTYDEGNSDRFQNGNRLSETALPDPSRGGDQSFLTTTYTYTTAFNEVQTITAPRGNDPSYVPQNGGTQSTARYTTTYSYDSTGNLITIRQPTVTLLGGGLQSIQTDSTYNSFGQVTSETDPEGNVTEYQYCSTATPNCSSPVTGGGGYLQRRIVDSTTSPRRTEPTPPVAIVQQFFYDPVGNIVRTLDGRGNDMLYAVNQLNQVVESQSEAPFRDTILFFYDANDNLVRKDVENKVPTTTGGKPNFTTGGNFSTTAGTPAFFSNLYTYDILDKQVKDDEDATGSAPSRVVTQFRYDPNRNPTQVIQPAGNSVRYQYDERNLVFTYTRGFGSSAASVTTVSYDVNGNTANKVDGRGFAMVLGYDGYDRRTKVSDPAGGQGIVHYDPEGNIVSTEGFGQPGGPTPGNNSGAGNVLLRSQTFLYDELSRQFQENQNPINGTSFVAAGVVTARPPSVTPGPLVSGVIASRTIFDRNNRITQRIEDDLATTLAQYDGVNRRVLITDAQSNTLQTTYDNNNNVIQTVETEISQKSGVASEVFTTAFQYDSRNRRTLLSDNCANTSRSAYDSRNNLTNSTDAKGDTTTGCPGVVNAQGNSSRYAYDGMSRRLQVIHDLRTGGVGSGPIDTSNTFNPLGQIATTTAYDGNGRIISMADGNGNTSRYTYDTLNRITRETLADSSFRNLIYDLNDNVVTYTDNNGSISARAYDSLNRLTATSVTPAPGVVGTTASSYQYDGLSRITRMTDNNIPSDATSLSTVLIAYDSLSRPVEEIQNGKAVDSAWVAQAQRQGVTYPNSRQLSYTFDLLERVATIQDTGATGNIAAYTYIGPRRVLERQFQNGTVETFLDNTGSNDIGYDGNRRAVELRHLNSTNALLAGFTYNYDREDNKTYEEKLHSTNNSEVYGYDSAYRATDFERGQLNATKTGIAPGTLTKSQQWTLDAAGNWRVNILDGTPENRSVNSVNEYTQVGATGLVSDRNGNITRDGNRGYQWDYRNRLRVVCSLPAGASNCASPSAVLLAVYSYDARNRRTRKTVTNSGSLNGITSYYYDDWQTIEERDGADVLTQQYVYGVYPDELLVLDRNLNGDGTATGPGDQRLFGHQNAQYSTFALTDSGGAVVEGYQYDAYGQQTVFSAGFGGVIGSVSANGNPYLFTGQRFDPESGLMYYRNRYYSSALGRFLSRDPIGSSPDLDLNLFEYANNNPYNLVDPSGCGFWSAVTGAVAGAVVAAAAAAVTVAVVAAVVVTAPVSVPALIVGAAVTAAVVGGVAGGIAAGVSTDDPVEGLKIGAKVGLVTGVAVGLAAAIPGVAPVYASIGTAVGSKVVAAATAVGLIGPQTADRWQHALQNRTAIIPQIPIPPSALQQPPQVQVLEPEIRCRIFDRISFYAADLTKFNRRELAWMARYFEETYGWSLSYFNEFLQRAGVSPLTVQEVTDVAYYWTVRGLE
jgi:RHS repeat-associated protein